MVSVKISPSSDTSGPTPAALCPHCGGTTLWRAGIHQGRQRYKCRDCRATSYGTPAFTSPPPPPCPRCGERAVRGGPSDTGTQTYRCTACHRRFIPPPPFAPKLLPGGQHAKCHSCGSEDLVFNGIQSGGKQRYKCRPCQRATYGTKPEPLPERPCPYCHSPCRSKGRDENNLPRYRCTACGRRNTGLFPAPPRGKDGPYRWRRSFCLDIASSTAIANYCNRHVMNVSQAVRSIFHEAAEREYARPTLGLRTRADDGSLRHTLIPSPLKEPSLQLPRHLPDLRPQAARERLSRDPEIRHMPLIYITTQVTVCLDDKAYTGLLRTMHRLGLNHQQAARHLITETAKPAQIPIAILTRGAYRARSLGTT